MDPATLALIITVCLPATGLGATYLATILTRKGKKEDQKLTERQTAYDELYQLNEARGAEIDRLNAAILAVRNEGEARWDRQVARCRTITETLSRAIAKLQETQPHEPVATEALTELEHHNEDDHGGREERP